MKLLQWPVRLAVGVLLALEVVASAAQTEDAAIVRVSPPEREVRVGDVFDAEVMVIGVRGLGAFEFTFAYDEAALEFDDVEEGDFLGSSGRTVNCFPPQPLSGAVRFRCVTLGAEPEGPDGSGVLAKVKMKALREGIASLEIESAIVTTIDAQPITRSLEGSSLTVLAPPEGGGGGANWAFLGPAIAVVAGLVLLGGLLGWQRMRPR